MSTKNCSILSKSDVDPLLCSKPSHNSFLPYTILLAYPTFKHFFFRQSFTELIHSFTVSLLNDYPHTLPHTPFYHSPFLIWLHQCRTLSSTLFATWNNSLICGQYFIPIPSKPLRLLNCTALILDHLFSPYHFFTAIQQNRQAIHLASPSHTQDADLYH